MCNDSISRQVALEKEMSALGVSRYLKIKESGVETSLPPGQRLLRESVLPLVDAINAWIKDVRGGHARRYASIANKIEAVGIEECAYITQKRLIDALVVRQRATAFSVHLGSDLELEIEFRELRNDAPKLFNHMQRTISKVTSERHRVTCMNMAKRLAGVGNAGWSKDEKLKLGCKLLELSMQATGLTEIDTRKLGVNKTTHYIVGTSKVREWLMKQHGTCQLLAPFNLPLVCQPKEWVSPFEGGYYTLPLPLFMGVNRGYLEGLENEYMPTVYKSINVLQRTAWRINTRILNTLKAIWDTGGDRAGVPLRDGEPIPTKPVDIDTNTEARKAWRKQAAAAHEWNSRNLSKVLATVQKLWIADKYRDEAAIYFAWSLDWRGRAYAIGTSLTPQADDSGRALLEFSEGKPLGPSGAAWLAVHLANSWGNDKVSFEERIQWVEDNHAMIVSCAFDPLTHKEWMDADAPFAFLAACFEWLGYTMEGDDYVSHLPVQVDGSCNGLQNYSAMLLDEVGGMATNLVPSDKPQDIYGLVAAEANRIIERDFCAKHTAVAYVFRGKITRKLTKRNTMTMPYSVTSYGMTEQLLEEFRKMESSGEPFDFQGEDMFGCASYLAKVNYEAIGTVVVAARRAMDWLKEVAKTVAKTGEPITWTSPVGLRVRQEYKEHTGERVRVTLGGKLVNFFINRDSARLNSRKQTSGIAPNFIHSCDAAHMMRTVATARNAGISNLSFIHDSFGTHAANMSELSQILRETFVTQYSGDVLGEFHRQVSEQLVQAGRSDLLRELPPIPHKGTLNLNAVLGSRYFFA
jgi:DNA-directed RNA polymerase